MQKIILFLFFLLFYVFAYSQDVNAKKYAKTITVDDLYARLAVLSADSLEGRETGKPGANKAAAFIASHFEKIGLEPIVAAADGMSFIQPYPLYRGTWNTIYLKKGTEKREQFNDFLYFSRSETKGEELLEFVFVGGEGLKWQGDIAGKVAVIQSKPGWAGYRELVSSLIAQNAYAVFTIMSDDNEFTFSINRFKNSLSRPRESGALTDEPRTAFIGNNAAAWLFDKSVKDLEPGDRTKAILNADLIIEQIDATNVMGMIKGQKFPDEYIFITSHYDHIGISPDGQINNGADDDGSGTSTVMEIAEAFALAAKNGSKPDRSMVFLCFSGEEKGLLGSAYYTDNPVIPLEKTIVNLNIDMVGRLDDKYAKNPNYIYLIGSDKLSSSLHALSEQVNKNTVKLKLDYTYNDDNDPNRFYYRSDHYNFAKNGIPVIFYFNGTHADYHKPTDTIEKINFPSMKKRADLIFYTAWEIANRRERIVADK